MSEYELGDLVWANVGRPYNWWPGQVMDSTQASKAALKLKKPGSVCINFFGDNEHGFYPAKDVEPLHKNFAEHIHQQHSTTHGKKWFQRAVEEAQELEDVRAGRTPKTHWDPVDCTRPETWQRVAAVDVVDADDAPMQYPAEATAADVRAASTAEVTAWFRKAATATGAACTDLLTEHKVAVPSSRQLWFHKRKRAIAQPGIGQVTASKSSSRANTGSSKKALPAGKPRAAVGRRISDSDAANALLQLHGNAAVPASSNRETELEEIRGTPGSAAAAATQQKRKQSLQQSEQERSLTADGPAAQQPLPTSSSTADKATAAAKRWLLGPVPATAAAPATAGSWTAKGKRPRAAEDDQRPSKRSKDSSQGEEDKQGDAALAEPQKQAFKQRSRYSSGAETSKQSGAAAAAPQQQTSKQHNRNSSAAEASKRDRAAAAEYQQQTSAQHDKSSTAADASKQDTAAAAEQKQQLTKQCSRTRTAAVVSKQDTAADFQPQTSQCNRLSSAARPGKQGIAVAPTNQKQTNKLHIRNSTAARPSKQDAATAPQPQQNIGKQHSRDSSGIQTGKQDTGGSVAMHKQAGMGAAVKAHLLQRAGRVSAAVAEKTQQQPVQQNSSSLEGSQRKPGRPRKQPEGQNQQPKQHAAAVQQVKPAAVQQQQQANDAVAAAAEEASTPFRRLKRARKSNRFGVERLDNSLSVIPDALPPDDPLLHDEQLMAYGGPLKVEFQEVVRFLALAAREPERIVEHMTHGQAKAIAAVLRWREANFSRTSLKVRGHIDVHLRQALERAGAMPVPPRPAEGPGAPLQHLTEEVYRDILRFWSDAFAAMSVSCDSSSDGSDAADALCGQGADGNANSRGSPAVHGATESQQQSLAEFAAAAAGTDDQFSNGIQGAVSSNEDLPKSSPNAKHQQQAKDQQQEEDQQQQEQQRPRVCSSAMQAYAALADYVAARESTPAERQQQALQRLADTAKPSRYFADAYVKQEDWAAAAAGSPSMIEIRVKEYSGMFGSREAFMAMLHQWAAAAKKDLSIAGIGDHQVDLYMLFKLTADKGGFLAACQRRAWRGILKQVNPFLLEDTAAGTAVTQAYKQQLIEFEDLISKDCPTRLATFKATTAAVPGAEAAAAAAEPGHTIHQGPEAPDRAHGAKQQQQQQGGEDAVQAREGKGQAWLQRRRRTAGAVVDTLRERSPAANSKVLKPHTGPQPDQDPEPDMRRLHIKFRPGKNMPLPLYILQKAQRYQHDLRADDVRLNAEKGVIVVTFANVALAVLAEKAFKQKGSVWMKVHEDESVEYKRVRATLLHDKPNRPAMRPPPADGDKQQQQQQHTEEWQQRQQQPLQPPGLCSSEPHAGSGHHQHAAETLHATLPRLRPLPQQQQQPPPQGYSTQPPLHQQPPGASSGPLLLPHLVGAAGPGGPPPVVLQQQNPAGVPGPTLVLQQGLPGQGLPGNTMVLSAGPGGMHRPPLRGLVPVQQPPNSIEGLMPAPPPPPPAAAGASAAAAGCASHQALLDPRRQQQQQQAFTQTAWLSGFALQQPAASAMLSPPQPQLQAAGGAAGSSSGGAALPAGLVLQQLQQPQQQLEGGPGLQLPQLQQQVPAILQGLDVAAIMGAIQQVSGQLQQQQQKQEPIHHQQPQSGFRPSAQQLQQQLFALLGLDNRPIG